ncbi:hypothetical protein EJB05_27483 [Eragrostis curvula]|uniref:Uncharacterized protein n=1 Tax=Eragrostis curvula TaxID=38414 RepID=A0A5J9UMH4_9POAL|nr:hypothetical protein EJB05_27483 [Eragrostis curvula]
MQEPKQYSSTTVLGEVVDACHLQIFGTQQLPRHLPCRLPSLKRRNMHMANKIKEENLHAAARVLQASQPHRRYGAKQHSASECNMVI